MDHYFSKRFIKQLFLELADSRLQNGAAALAFYSMLAIFPTAIFALSLLPYLPIPDLQRAIFDLLGQRMPREAAELFNDTVHKIVSERHSGLLSFGLLFACGPRPAVCSLHSSSWMSFGARNTAAPRCGHAA
jgi:membrane protein